MKQYGDLKFLTDDTALYDIVERQPEAVMVAFAKSAHLWVAGIEVHRTQSPLWIGIQICISLHTTQSDAAGEKHITMTLTCTAMSQNCHYRTNATLLTMASCRNMLCNMGTKAWVQAGTGCN